jgi:hypothetical protein
MVKNQQTKFRIFGAWADDKEENWLGEMSRQGWHFQRYTPVGFYRFSPGEPLDYTYRLDFINSKIAHEEYVQLFKDAGWEYLGSTSGWQYFRTLNNDGTTPEIFSDAESKIQKYQRLLGFLVILLPVLIFSLTSTFDRQGSSIYAVAFFIQRIIFVFYAYAMIRIFLRIRRLRKI